VNYIKPIPLLLRKLFPIMNTVNNKDNTKILLITKILNDIQIQPGIKQGRLA